MATAAHNAAHAAMNLPRLVGAVHREAATLRLRRRHSFYELLAFLRFWQGALLTMPIWPARRETATRRALRRVGHRCNGALHQAGCQTARPRGVAHPPLSARGNGPGNRVLRRERWRRAEQQHEEAALGLRRADHKGRTLPSAGFRLGTHAGLLGDAVWANRFAQRYREPHLVLPLRIPVKPTLPRCHGATEQACVWSLGCVTGVPPRGLRRSRCRSVLLWPHMVLPCGSR
jgi:hypothetical protein